MKQLLILAAVLVPVTSQGATQGPDDCVEVSVGVRHAVKADPARVLEIVEDRISASPGCACEIVKAAIEETSAEPELVATIVETAVMVAPEHMRLISQCAVAVAPDALSEVQAVMIRLEPSTGEPGYSGKSAKMGAIGRDPGTGVKPAWNPLNFPGQGIGPGPGTWNPWIPIPPIPPIINPPIVEPPVGTPTDPEPPQDQELPIID